MEFQHIYTRCDGSGSTNSAADMLLTPVRALFGGRTYRIIKDENSEVINVMRSREQISKVEEVVRKVMAVLFTVILCIPVAIGVYLKWKALQETEVIENYNLWVSNYESNPKLLAPTIEGISLKPEWFEPSEVADIAAKVNENALLGFTSNQKEKNTLQTFIDKANDSGKWAYVQNPEFTANEFKTYLRLFVHYYRNCPDIELKFSALNQLIENGEKCDPTKVNVTIEAIKTLKGKDGEVKSRIIGILQRFKETQIQTFSQKNQWEWHALNYARAHWGDEFGLDTTAINHDSYQQGHQFTKAQCRKLIYSCWTTDNMVTEIRDFMKGEKPGDGEMLTAQMGQYLHGLVERKFNLGKEEAMNYINDRTGDELSDLATDVDPQEWLLDITYGHLTDYAIRLILQDLNLIG